MSIFLKEVVGVMLILSTMLLFYKVKELRWVYLKLKSRLLHYQANKENRRVRNYVLLKETDTIVKFYETFTVNALENLQLELELKSHRLRSPKNLVNFLTLSVVPSASIFTALLAVTNEVHKSDFQDLMVNIILFLVVGPVVLNMIYFISNLLILSPVEKHLLVIEKVLKKKSEMLPREVTHENP